MALTGVGGSANAQGGGSGSFEYGRGDWLVYGSGGGMRTGDYNTPTGRVANSFTEMTNAKLGIGRYGDRLQLERHAAPHGHDLRRARRPRPRRTRWG